MLKIEKKKKQLKKKMQKKVCKNCGNYLGKLSKIVEKYVKKLGKVLPKMARLWKKLKTYARLKVHWKFLPLKCHLWFITKWVEHFFKGDLPSLSFFSKNLSKNVSGNVEKFMCNYNILLIHLRYDLKKRDIFIWENSHFIKRMSTSTKKKVEI